MKAYLFPGQGAQRLGMGDELFSAYARMSDEASDILGYDIAALCRNGPIEKLSRTQYTQPTLYVVNCLRYVRHREETGERAEYLLGHSVGEYAALFAAGVLDFAGGLRLVAKRAALMAEAHGGGMAAVLGLDSDAVAELIVRENLSDIFPANFNTPRQTVVSGMKRAVEAAEEIFLAAGASHYKVLPVSGAFHTPFMADAQGSFAQEVASVDFAPQQVPVISNVTARPHADADVAARMVQQITAPVRWCESLRWLMSKGVTFADTVEIGPGGAPIMRPMFKRSELEAGPLDTMELERTIEPAPMLEKPAQTRMPSIGERVVAQAPQCARKSDASSSASSSRSRQISMENLGSRAFCEAFAVRYPYASGAMYQAIASTALVVRMASAGLLSFFGAAGLPTAEIRAAIRTIRSQLPQDAPFGVNFIAHVNRPHLEEELADVLIEEGVRVAEASAFMEVTPALVRYRAKGLDRAAGRTIARNRIVAKVSRPDVAAQFLDVAPQAIVARLLQTQAITRDEAELLRTVPMADAICVESDSGGHTDQGMPFALIPPILQRRDAAQRRFPDFGPLFVGAGGGIGTPEAAAAVLVLGSDFLVTGSINQCTPQAGTSDAVKDLLASIDVQDTAYAPSGEMFELGSKVQVARKGLFFPSRAEKLVALYRQHDSLEAIEPKARRQIEERYFGRGLDEVFADVEASYPASEIERARRMPKHRMALTFKRYFKDTTNWALAGDMDHKVDFQIHCGPAQGAFNQWVAGGELKSWQARDVDIIALKLLEETADILDSRFALMTRRGGA